MTHGPKRGVKAFGKIKGVIQAQKDVRGDRLFLIEKGSQSMQNAGK